MSLPTNAVLEPFYVSNSYQFICNRVVSPSKFVDKNYVTIASDPKFADQTNISASLDIHVSKDKGLASCFY